MTNSDLDAAIRAACLPNMRRALNGEPITADDIAAEQGALDGIRAAASDGEPESVEQDNGPDSAVVGGVS